MCYGSDLKNNLEPLLKSSTNQVFNCIKEVIMNKINSITFLIIALLMIAISFKCSDKRTNQENKSEIVSKTS